MPLGLTFLLTAMGVLYVLFARVKPPAFLESFFRVPGIFVFLPERHVVPVGRILTGILLLGVTAFLNFRFPPS